MIIETHTEQWPRVMFEDPEPRQPGLHLSTVIRSLLKDLGLGYSGKGFSDMNLTAEMGLLWENVLAIAMRDKYAIRPPQIQEDGVWMSPDGIGEDPNGEVPIALEEFKCTWRAVKNCPSENPYYMMQVKSYCRALDTPVAVMRIFHVMGDYRGSGPLYRVSRIKFTQRELDDNWRMILRHKKKMEVGNGKS